MLVVVTILAILMAVTTTSLRSARRRAWNAKARDTSRQIVQAWLWYQMDQHSFPDTTAFSGQKDGGYPTTIRNLAPLNRSARILNDGKYVTTKTLKDYSSYNTYLELSEDELFDKNRRAGDGLQDHWKQPYYFTLDFDYDGRLDHPAPVGNIPKKVTGGAVAWSRGGTGEKRDWIVQWQ